MSRVALKRTGYAFSLPTMKQSIPNPYKLLSGCWCHTEINRYRECFSILQQGGRTSGGSTAAQHAGALNVVCTHAGDFTITLWGYICTLLVYPFAGVIAYTRGFKSSNPFLEPKAGPSAEIFHYNP